MIICRHCGVHYEVFRSTCPSCGAPLQIEKPADFEKTQTQILAEKIRLICDDHINSDFKDRESITDKMMDRIRKSFRIFPNGKEIFFGNYILDAHGSFKQWFDITIDFITERTIQNNSNNPVNNISNLYKNTFSRNT
jgi:hypothetical protein